MALYPLSKIYHPEFGDSRKIAVNHGGVDRRNPITSGLSFLMASGDERNILTNVMPTTALAGKTPSTYGVGSTTVSGGVEQIDFANSDATTFGGGFTFFVYYEDLGVEGSSPGLVSRRTSFADGIVEMYYQTSSISITTQVAGDFQTRVFSGLTTRGSYSSPVCIAVSCDSSGAIGALKQLGQGVEIDNQSGITAEATGSHAFCISGLISGSSDNHAFGNYYLAGAFKRKLPEAELISLVNNPGQLLKPAVQLVYFTPTAAPPTGDAINDTYYKFLLAGGQL